MRRVLAVAIGVALLAALGAVPALAFGVTQDGEELTVAGDGFTVHLNKGAVTGYTYQGIDHFVQHVRMSSVLGDWSWGEQNGAELTRYDVLAGPSQVRIEFAGNYQNYMLQFSGVTTVFADGSVDFQVAQWPFVDTNFVELRADVVLPTALWSGATYTVLAGTDVSSATRRQGAVAEENEAGEGYGAHSLTALGEVPYAVTITAPSGESLTIESSSIHTPSHLELYDNRAWGEPALYFNFQSVYDDATVFEPDDAFHLHIRLMPN